MEPVHQVGQNGAEERLKQLRLIVAIVIVFLLGFVLGWFSHDHMIVHVKHSSAASAISTTSTRGGER